MKEIEVHVARDIRKIKLPAYHSHFMADYFSKYTKIREDLSVLEIELCTGDKTLPDTFANPVIRITKGEPVIKLIKKTGKYRMTKGDFHYFFGISSYVIDEKMFEAQVEKVKKFIE